MAEEKTIHGDYAGERVPLFHLAIKTALLTAITLGIYRFWAKTRIRKYIWSSASADGDSFEYTGTGLEKFLGFLVAIVILAIYLGVIQMILFYFGLHLFSEPTTEAQMIAQMGAIYITFLAVLPLIFFAQYRARRYKLARTRWRGMRFGAEQAAWGYAARALGHWFLTLITLGILLPRQTFYLEKFVTDRSWYGDARFEQTGKWTALYPAMKHLFIALAIMIAGVVVGVVTEIAALAGVAIAVGYIWGMIGLVSYRVRSFIYLTDNKVLDGTIRFSAQTKTSTIVWTVIGGGLLVGIIAGILFAILGGIVSVMIPGLVNGGGGAIVPFVVLALLYLVVLAVVMALSLVWITQPVIDHFVSTVSLRNADALKDIRQRAADSGADAEGFADALDVGGAI